MLLDSGELWPSIDLLGGHKLSWAGGLFAEQLELVGIELRMPSRLGGKCLRMLPGMGQLKFVGNQLRLHWGVGILQLKTGEEILGMQPGDLGIVQPKLGGKMLLAVADLLGKTGLGCWLTARHLRPLRHLVLDSHQHNQHSPIAADQ